MKLQFGRIFSSSSSSSVRSTLENVLDLIQTENSSRCIEQCSDPSVLRKNANSISLSIVYTCTQRRSDNYAPLRHYFYISRPCSHINLFFEYDCNYMKGARMSYPSDLHVLRGGWTRSHADAFSIVLTLPTLPRN